MLPQLTRSSPGAASTNGTKRRRAVKNCILIAQKDFCNIIWRWMVIDSWWLSAVWRIVKEWILLAQEENLQLYIPHRRAQIRNKFHPMRFKWNYPDMIYARNKRVSWKGNDSGIRYQSKNREITQRTAKAHGYEYPWADASRSATGVNGACTRVMDASIAVFFPAKRVAAFSNSLMGILSSSVKLVNELVDGTARESCCHNGSQPSLFS